MIRESRHDDWLYTLLHERSTIEMNAITANFILSIYPFVTQNHLTHTNRRMRVNTGILPNVYAKHKIRTVDETFGHVGRCSFGCPFKVRSTTSFANMGVFYWQHIQPEHSSHNAISMTSVAHNYTWRLGYTCMNPFCEHYRLTTFNTGIKIPSVTKHMNVVIERKHSLHRLMFRV